MPEVRKFMPQEKKNLFIRLLYAGLFAAALLLFIKYILKWILPFLLAFFTARLIQRPIKFLIKKFNFKQGFAAGVCSAITIIIILGLAFLITYGGIYELTSLGRRLPDVLRQVPDVANNVQCRIDGFISSLPEPMGEYLTSALDTIIEETASIPEAIYRKLLDFLSSAAEMAPRVGLFFVTYCISVFFITGSYCQITEFILRQVPKRFRETAINIKNDFSSTVFKWLKAQLTLMAITFAELTLALYIIGIDYAVITAGIIALIDALPVFGIGTVLIPWAAVVLICGNTGRGIALIVIYGIISLIRSFLEPKLVSRQMGLHPIATVIAMYIGFCTLGLAGMILLPIVLMVLKQLNDNRYIRLWKP